MNKFQLNYKDRGSRIFDKLLDYRFDEYAWRFGDGMRSAIRIGKYGIVKIKKCFILGAKPGDPDFDGVCIESIYDEKTMEYCYTSSFKKAYEVVDLYINKLKNMPNLDEIIKKYYEV